MAKQPQIDAPFGIGDHVHVHCSIPEDRWEGPFEVTNTKGSTVTISFHGTPAKFKAEHLKRITIEPRTPLSIVGPTDPDHENESTDPVEDKETDEVKQDPDPEMTSKKLVGARVRVYWSKQWYSGTVIGRKRTRHPVRYRMTNDQKTLLKNKRKTTMSVSLATER